MLIEKSMECHNHESHASIKLTHISLTSHFRDISKQCRPRSDAVSDQGLHCLLTGISIKEIGLQLLLYF